MSDTPAPLSGASTPTPRRTFRPWILIFLAIVILGGSAFWLADGSNRYHASQEMRAGRLALLASDLPKALGHFRAAAILRPTDEAVTVQYDQTQSRWVGLVEQQLQKLAPADAYLAWVKLPATEGELVEPHASRYREIRTRVEAGARGVAEQFIADARSARDGDDFARAYELLHKAEPFAALVPELRQRLKEAQAADVAHAVVVAQAALAGADFGQAREVLKSVAALGANDEEFRKMGPAIDEAEVAHAIAAAHEAMTGEKFNEAREILAPVATLAAQNEEYLKLGPAIDEAEFRVRLRDAAAAADKNDFESATAALAAATGLKVLPDEVKAAHETLRKRAGAAIGVELASGLARNDEAAVNAAVARGQEFAGWESGSSAALLEPADLPSFLTALEAFGLGPMAQAENLIRLDVVLVLYCAKKFPEAQLVPFARENLLGWSRAMRARGLAGSALYLDEEARRFGAPDDAAWRRETVAQATERAKVELAIAPAEPNRDAPAGLGEAATAALRKGLEARLGNWPKMVAYDPGKPATVVFEGAYAGYYEGDDDSTVTRRTVRYQSGTRTVPNWERDQLVAEHNDLIERYNQVSASMQDKEDFVAQVNNNYNATAWDRSQATNKSIEIAGDRALLATWRNQMANLRAQGDAMPKNLTEPLYADEGYDVIDHVYTCHLFWELTANLHGQQVDLGEWSATAEFKTQEVDGNASRGVPVRKPDPVPKAKLMPGLVKDLVAEIGQVDAIVEQLPEMTMQAFVNFYQEKQAVPLAQAEGFLVLAYAWESTGRKPGFAANVRNYAREVLNLPLEASGE